MTVEHDESVNSIPRASIDEDGSITVPAEAVAPGLGLKPETFVEKLRAGAVYQTPEQGVAEDAGRLRVTFRYRSRAFRIVIEADGTIGPTPDAL